MLQTSFCLSPGKHALEFPWDTYLGVELLEILGYTHTQIYKLVANWFQESAFASAPARYHWISKCLNIRTSYYSDSRVQVTPIATSEQNRIPERMSYPKKCSAASQVHGHHPPNYHLNTRTSEDLFLLLRALESKTHLCALPCHYLWAGPTPAAHQLHSAFC